tara:strand:- start:15774 stop:16682 length:909 start_codon:yes stop_codon:yes gene_type:complete
MGNVAPVKVNQEQAIAKKTGLDVSQISAGVVMYGDKPFVNITGKRYKMDDRFGPGKWGTRVDQIKGDDYDHMLKMWGKKPPCIIMKAQILFNGDVLAEDYGWSSPDSAPAGARQFEKDGIGIASSKAQSRAMSQLVANGFASEEKAERGRMMIETGSIEAGFLRDSSKLKKEIGPEKYYKVLKDHDVEHADDPKLQGSPKKMQAILNDMKHGDAWEVIENESIDRVGLLGKIIDADVPHQARENAVIALMMDLENEEKLVGECPLESDQTYAEIMAEYVSKSMKESNFEKAYDVLKRSMELV